MAVKKKAAPKKKVAAKKKVVNKKAIGEISPHTAKVAVAIDKAKAKASSKKKSAKKKSAPKKKAPAKKRSHNLKRDRARGPIPKYHLNHQSWDKPVVMALICDELMNSSKGIAYICKDNDDYPTIAIVHKWWADEVKAGADRPLLDIYTQAKAAQMDFISDEGIHIADNEASEPLVIDGVPVTVGGKLIMTTTSASVQRAKLRIESRRWVAERLAHRKYGNKLEVSGDPERPLAGLTTEQLILRQKQLQDKLDGGS